ncbi:MAG: DUF1156 domain-containing protein [Thaumarchaeota archaeon]|nr:DUF1156 domain-containing protein [Nitrososphaerota archaeon]
MSEKLPYKKKLIEVALPLEAINKASSMEKSIRQGHPSTMHTWWARRPLASCRAVLFASLVDDPGNYLNPIKAKKERERLFRLIEKLVLWKNTNNEDVIREAQKEIKKSLGDELPVFLDPFCGGGSIPLEAQRLGLRVYASDLNPVAVLLTKALIEIPQRFVGKSPVNRNILNKQTTKTHYRGLEGLATDIEYYGNWINDEAKKKIGHLYPQVNGKDVIAWIWARAIKCPNPACGAQIPLMRSFELSKQEGKKIWLIPIVNKNEKKVDFKIEIGSGKIPSSTINGRIGADCLVCPHSASIDYIRNEGKSGRMSLRLLAIISESEKGRKCTLPTEEHLEVLKKIKPSFSPDIELPYNSRYLTVPEYGLKTFADLFTTRQLNALVTFSDLVIEAHKKIFDDAVQAGFNDDKLNLDDGGMGAKAYADAITTYLSFAVDRCANYWSSLTPWGGSFIVQTFSRQAIPMVWDFAEANPFSDSTGNWQGAVKWITLCVKQSIPPRGQGTVLQLDVSKTLTPGITPMISTDPPYYNMIGYSDLSDFFYVWLRRSLSKIYPMLFSTVLTPKNEEVVSMPHRFNGDKKLAKQFFLENLSKALRLIHKNSRKDLPMTIFYAFKQEDEDNNSDGKTLVSTGWETMLEALISSGFQIVGTWPIRTERSEGMKTSKNVLASSILLVCRHKLSDASPANVREFVTTLRKELPSALVTLQHGSIAPVDLAQATIGPSMAIFSKFSKVLEADGSQMSVRSALQIINQELDSCLNAQDSELDPETRFCVSWFEQYGMEKGPFGEADVLARAKNTSVDALTNIGALKASAGKVKLLNRSEYPEDMDFKKLERICVWVSTQDLIRKLETEGEDGSAKTVKMLGARQSEISKDLAYRLYSICNKKGWLDEALAYNSLVVSWPTIQGKAGIESVPEGQTRL